MTFDPTKPVEDSPLDAAEVRDQMNALKALIDAQAAQITTQQAAISDLQSQLNDLSLFAGDTNQSLIELQQQVAALQGNH